jgi:DNA-binding transcriptional MerR regulator/methylmalonyl-CoA mutase cobalamin-binding subunit
MTGVNPITLRAWERRHGFIRPTRTGTGRRMYRREDIDLINRVLALLERGVSVGQVRKSLQQAPAEESAATSQPWARYQERMIGAIARFDEADLDECYSEMLALYSIGDVTTNLLLPLLRQVGKRWETARGSIAEEHFFAVYLRNKLGARFHHRARRPHGARVLAACLPCEQHELGLLLFALVASEHGIEPVLLGANMPREELPLAAKRARAEAIVLSGSVPLDAKIIADELPALVARAAVPVFVGGMTSVRDEAAICGAGATPLGTDPDVGAERVREALGQTAARTEARS